MYSPVAGEFAMMDTPDTPVRVITVEREYGSRGGEFAHDLAARLGWRLLDAELACRAAKRAGVSPELAAQFDERLDPWYYRYGKVFWHDPVYPVSNLSDEMVFDAERMMSLVRLEILQAAQEGNCVLVGRGAACALQGHPGCFHVFVYASPSAKREWFAESFPERAQQADQQIAAFNKRRAGAIRQFYHQEWCSHGLYHVLLNAEIGIEAMIAATEGATRLLGAPAVALAG